MTSHQQPQPKDLSTAERLKMTLGAVTQGIRYTLKGQHQTEGKAQLTVEPEDVERIIAGWPAPQQNVARQLLAKYGPPMRPPRPGCSGTTIGPGSGPSFRRPAGRHRGPG